MPDPQKNRGAYSFVIAGMGSIGKRHLQNLLSLGVRNLTLYRTGQGVLDSADFAEYPTERILPKVLSRKPTGVIISNPTALHMEVALQAAHAGCNILIEKPVSHTLAGVKELEHLIHQKGIKVLVGFQFRFHPGLRQIKRWIDDRILGSALAVSVHWGEFLPAWHPWEDYRKGYSARKDMGGGVLLTLCHPFDYLRWIFGEVISVSAMTGHVSSLDLDTEDLALALLRFSSGLLASVHLDYFRRPPRHHLTIICEEGVLTWDYEDGCATLQDGATHKRNRICPPETFERNTLFRDEMAHFLDCIESNHPPICSFTDGLQALRIVLAAKKSVQERREIEIESIV